MKNRSMIRAVLLLVVGGSLFFWAMRRPQPIAAETAAADAAAVAAADVVVTYFTTDVRCDSCRKIEALTRRAVDEGFADELASGRLVFRMVNTDRPEHAHFLEHYEIANKIVIVSWQRDAAEVEWTPRQDIWLLLDEPDEFLPYVRQPIHDYLARS